MKNLILIILMMGSIATTSWAQSKASAKQERNKLLVSYIKKQLDLTPEESEKFWPIYKAYKKEKKEIRVSKRRKKIDIDLLSDKELEQKMLADLEQKTKNATLEKRYYQKFSTVLSVRKLAKFYEAERSYKQKALQLFNRK